MFGQLSNRETLRDFVLATQAHASKAYNLGFVVNMLRRVLLPMQLQNETIASSRNTPTVYLLKHIFVVRDKKNNSFKSMKWKRRFKPESGILSDATGYMDGRLSMDKYPDKIRRIIYCNEENKRKFISRQIADWTLFQVAEATSEDLKNLEQDREWCQNPDIFCNHSLLHDGYCAEKDGYWQNNLRDGANRKYFTYKHYWL